MKVVAPPPVTVLMTVYNGGKYLKSSVQSVLNQTFRDFQFLIINDCSTDNSIDIIESFNDDRIVIHHNENNLGQTKSLNIGLRLAKGKYVARMDADDMAFPLWLEKLLDYIEQHPQYAVVGTAAVVIDKEGEKRGRGILNLIRKAPVSYDEVLFRIFFAPPMNHVTVIMNKEQVLANGGYDEEFKVAQDYELWSSLVRSGSLVINIPDILVAYRFHQDSVSFREANRRVLHEKSETIFRNVCTMTNLEFNRDDASKICRLFYSASDLTTEEIEQARDNFEKIYTNLKKQFKLPTHRIKKNIKTQMVRPYYQIAMHAILSNNISGARKAALGYLDRYGFHMIPALIYLASFAGLAVCKSLPFFYEKLLEIFTYIKLKLKPDTA